MNFLTLTVPDWDDLKKEILQEIRLLGERNEKRFLKSAEVRQMLGGISAAKLQSLRTGGHLPAIYADGLWLYDVSDIMAFISKNKVGGEEASGA